ncbi:unnamed protein product [Sphagnum tenellum]
MVKDMANNVMAMMQHKIDAIKVQISCPIGGSKQLSNQISLLFQRIMEFAENLALDHKFDKELGHRLKDAPSAGGFHYFNAKKINVVSPEDDDDIPDEQKFLSAHDRPEDDPRFAVGFSRVELERQRALLGDPRQHQHQRRSCSHQRVRRRCYHSPAAPNGRILFRKICVFIADPKVVNAIKWSRGLDSVFMDNYNRDPSLSWQYFGSSSGFMRQYPGT